MRKEIENLLEDPSVDKFLYFRSMLTPRLVQPAYWLALVAIVWNGLGHMFSGGLLNFIEGIVFVFLAAIITRIIAELVMVLFQIHENSVKLAELAALPPPSAAQTRTQTQGGSAGRKKRRKKAVKNVANKASNVSQKPTSESADDG